MRGRREELTRALGRLRGCQVFPAVDRDLLVVVTDTPDEAADEALQRALADVPALDALALVAGVGEAAIGSDRAPAGAPEPGAP